jgi:hypothetical protein
MSTSNTLMDRGPAASGRSTRAHDPMQPLIEELLRLIRRGPAGQAKVSAAPQNLAQIADGALRLLDQLSEVRGAGTTQQAADIEELSGLIQSLIEQTRPTA